MLSQVIDKTLRLQGLPTYENLKLLLTRDETSKNSLKEPTSTDSWLLFERGYYQVESTDHGVMKTKLKNFDMPGNTSILIIVKHNSQA